MATKPPSEYKNEAPVEQTADAAIAQATAERKAEEAKAKASTAPKFKVKRRVTLAQLKMAAEKPYYLKIISKIVQSEPAKDAKGNVVKTDMEPPHICQAVDLTTGDAMQIICPTIMHIDLTKNYPDESYVGLSFEVIRHEKATGKRYATFSIAEIEVE